MSDERELPIALRRTPRRSSSGPTLAPAGRPHRGGDVPHEPLPSSSSGLLSRGGSSMAAATPARKPRPRKRVRFSDPGPLATAASPPAVASTGLTPMVRKTSLGIAPKKRRHSTPYRRSASGTGVRPAGEAERDADNDDDDDGEAPPAGGVSMHVLPLRQVLDGRVRRRIRRNGLSEEMNVISAEKRRRARETRAEIERLQAEVAARDAEIRRLQEETVVFDSERVWALEREVAALQQELARRATGHGLPVVAGDGGSSSSSPTYDWTVAARDPFADERMRDVDEDEDRPAALRIDDQDSDFGDTTVGHLAFSTPTRRVHTSFLTPPTTSPAAAPSTPCSHRPITTPASSHVGVQADLADPDKQRLEDELASLRRERAKLDDSLESYAALAARLSQQLAPFPPRDAAEPVQDSGGGEGGGAGGASSAAPSEIEARLASLLEALSDRTAALLELNAALSGLGFPGSDPAEIVASLATAFRAARLELEYLDPGEIALPLASAGAATLDLLLSRLRELARRVRDADAAVDEYHAQELSLRQQLGARVDACDGMAADLAARDARIADLELQVDRLRGASERYERDIAELERLAQRLDADLRAATTAATAATDTADTTADLEARLAEVAELRAQIESLTASHAAERDERHAEHRGQLDALHREHGRALALRDARVTELRGELERVNAALAEAHETVRRLRVEAAKLAAEKEALAREAAARERGRARDVVRTMRAELERVVSVGEGALATPRKGGRTPPPSLGGPSSERGDTTTPPSAVETDEVSLVALHAAATRRRRADGPNKDPSYSRKRRRHDSGLGLLDEEDVDA